MAKRYDGDYDLYAANVYRRGLRNEFPVYAGAKVVVRISFGPRRDGGDIGGDADVF